jgi:ribosomal protein S27AE
MTDKVFTAVFRNVTTDEAREIGQHPKWSAGSWSHALDDRDAARAELERLREENKQLAAFVVAVGGVWEPNGARSVLTGELSLAESIRKDAAIATAAHERSQPVAGVTITKPGDSLTGISFMSLNEHGRATLGKGRHELYAHPPADALYTMDQMREYADAFHKSRVEAAAARPECVDCGDSIMAHDPGTCGNCHSMKYASGDTISQMREFLVPDCKPGGCASIGCEGGFYCFNADGTPKPGMTPEQQEKLRAALTKVFAPTTPCECRACLKGKTVDTGFGAMPVEMTRMIVCAKCSNKRCPHANDHRNTCTDSNEPGQPGSAY